MMLFQRIFDNNFGLTDSKHGRVVDGVLCISTLSEAAFYDNFQFTFRELETFDILSLSIGFER